MNESITEIFYKQLKENSNKTAVLVNFYKELFELNSVDDNIYPTFGRLIKIYGEDVIYFSLLDCLSLENLNHNGIHKAISFFAKKRLQEKYSLSAIPSLDSIVQKNIKDLEKKKRIKIPDVEI